jgi:sRNA-binding protein
LYTERYHTDRTDVNVKTRPKSPSPYHPRPRQPLTPDELACLEILLDRWPDAFDLDEPGPFAIGIHETIIAAEPALVGPELDAVLRWYTTRGAYVIALAQGGKRADLDGKPVGEVSASEQRFAMRAVMNFNLRGRWDRADWPVLVKGGVE